jgi:hypothetical protein
MSPREETLGNQDAVLLFWARTSGTKTRLQAERWPVSASRELGDERLLDLETSRTAYDVGIDSLELACSISRLSSTGPHVCVAIAGV